MVDQQRAQAWLTALARRLLMRLCRKTLASPMTAGGWTPEECKGDMPSCAAMLGRKLDA